MRDGLDSVRPTAYASRCQWPTLQIAIDAARARGFDECDHDQIARKNIVWRSQVKESSCPSSTSVVVLLPLVVARLSPSFSSPNPPRRWCTPIDGSQVPVGMLLQCPLAPTSTLDGTGTAHPRSPAQHTTRHAVRREHQRRVFPSPPRVSTDVQQNVSDSHFDLAAFVDHQRTQLTRGQMTHGVL